MDIFGNLDTWLHDGPVHHDLRRLLRLRRPDRQHHQQQLRRHLRPGRALHQGRRCPWGPPTPSSVPSSAPSCDSPGGPCATASAEPSGPSSPPSAWPSRWPGCGYLVAAADDPADFTIFMVALLAMFFFAGVGNASTFKQMPMIMPKRQAGGAIGFTAAVASLGPFLVGIALDPHADARLLLQLRRLLRRVRRHLLDPLRQPGAKRSRADPPPAPVGTPARRGPPPITD